MEAEEKLDLVIAAAKVLLIRLNTNRYCATDWDRLVKFINEFQQPTTQPIFLKFYNETEQLIKLMEHVGPLPEITTTLDYSLLKEASDLLKQTNKLLDDIDQRRRRLQT